MLNAFHLCKYNGDRKEDVSVNAHTMQSSILDLRFLTTYLPDVSKWDGVGGFGAGEQPNFCSRLPLQVAINTNAPFTLMALMLHA